MQTCSGCRFAVDIAELGAGERRILQCHRRAPTIAATHGEASTWPRVYADDACGESQSPAAASTWLARATAWLQALIARGRG